MSKVKQNCQNRIFLGSVIPNRDQESLFALDFNCLWKAVLTPWPAIMTIPKILLLSRVHTVLGVWIPYIISIAIPSLSSSSSSHHINIPVANPIDLLNQHHIVGDKWHYWAPSPHPPSPLYELPGPVGVWAVNCPCPCAPLAQYCPAPGLWLLPHCPLPCPLPSPSLPT